MERVNVGNIDSRMGPADVKRPLSEALGTTDLAINYYELAPGDGFAFGYHAHTKQEEVFYVQSGAVTFETADGSTVVEAGEVVRFAPGEFQQGVNRGDERVVALALGAPRRRSDLEELLRECENCGGRTPNAIEMTDGRDALVTVCEECGAETGRFT